MNSCREIHLRYHIRLLKTPGPLYFGSDAKFRDIYDIMSDKGIQSHINACSHADLYDLEDRTYMRKKDMRFYEHIDFRMDVGLRE